MIPRVQAASFPLFLYPLERYPVKTLFLLRHAKSSWDDPYLSDSLRPLAPRGRKAAPRMGAYMAQKGFIPDRVLCSVARRAVETWDLVSEELKHTLEVEIREDLYHATPENILSTLQGLPPYLKSVLLVGHNPTFEELALSLSGKGPKAPMSEMRRKYPTGALAIIDFHVDRWTDVRRGSGHLRDFVRPRDLS